MTASNLQQIFHLHSRFIQKQSGSFLKKKHAQPHWKIPDSSISFGISDFFSSTFLIIFAAICTFPSKFHAYDKSSWVEKSWIYEAISYYPFEGNEKILDIGCGDGEISSLLSQKAIHGEVYAIDIAPPMIDYASQTWTQKNLRFELQDIETIECEEKFDLITAFFTFQWIKNKKKMLENCAQLLSPRGHIWMVTPLNIPAELDAAARFVCQNPKWNAFFTNFQLPTNYPSQQEVHELLCKQGISPIYIKTRQKEMIFGSRQDLHKALRISFPYLHCLSEDMLDPFLTDLLDRYLMLRPLDRYHRASCILETVEVIGVKNWKCRLCAQPLPGTLEKSFLDFFSEKKLLSLFLQ